MKARQRTTYAAVVGQRLRAVRLEQRLSLNAVAAASAQEFRASALGAYERGERAISVSRLQRLARLYRISVDDLLPRQLGARTRHDYARDGDGTKVGGVKIDLPALAEAPGAQAAALRRYVTSIQMQRRSASTDSLTVRTEDLRVIGASFGLAAEELLSGLSALGVFPRA